MNPNSSEMIREYKADRCLDCTGLRCPLPIVRVSKTIKEMSCGQTLSITATDPAFKSDLEAWVRTMGHELLEFSDGATQEAWIRKRPLSEETP